MEPQPSLTLSETESGATDLDGPILRQGPIVDTVEHTLDTKTRLTLPAAMRPQFAEGGLLVPWKGPCVALFTDARFAQWIGHLKQVIPVAGYDNPGAHIAFAHAQAARFRPDAQGRFALVDRLRFAAGIDRDVTIVGAGSRVELWDPATYGRDSPEYRDNIEFHQDGFDLLDDVS